MEISFSTAQNGLFAGTLRQNIIANNLSNLTTDGFKTRLAEQETLRLHGTRIQGIQSDFSAGSPRETQIDEHLYIAGDGFFQVQLDGATAYTRLGNFHTDSEGNLVTPSGHIVEPAIVVPDDSIGIQVAADGVVYSIDPDRNAVEIGQLELARFVNPNGLEDIGDNLYVLGDNSGDAQEGTPGESGLGSILQGFVEQSNVDPATEITQQIINQRYYQLNLRVLQTTDSMVGRAVDLFS